MKHILITEDDPFTANICSDKFSQGGFEVSLAHDGKAAIELLKSHPPDVVLLDLMLPEIDGIGVLRFIRSQESLRDLPVIVWSNSTAFSSLAKSARDAGATNFLNKGNIGPQKLLDEVNKLLSITPIFIPMPMPQPAQPPSPPAAASIKVSARAIRVIIADDDNVIHSVLGFFMGQAGYVVRSAFNGRQAMEMAQADPPDIMVLDAMMPKLDGFEVLNLWRKHPLLAKIPVIMLTASKNDARKFEALASGVVKFITKPFSPDTLVETIRQFAGKHS
jgi:CheY-like chemotaxis protein